MWTSYFGFWLTTLSGFMKKASTYHSGYASAFFIRLPRLSSKSLQSVYILMASLVIVISSLTLAPSPAFAQNKGADPQQEKEGEGKVKPFNKVYGFHTGPLLPNQVPDMTEIMPVWGLHYGFNVKKSLLELGVANANSMGTTYYNVSGSFRGDFQLDDLSGLLFVGLDLHYYKTQENPYRSFVGAHVGGGFTAHISDAMWFRADMKFNMNPGTGLYIGFGFEFRESGGGGEGNQEQQ